MIDWKSNYLTLRTITAHRLEEGSRPALSSELVMAKLQQLEWRMAFIDRAAERGVLPIPTVELLVCGGWGRPLRESFERLGFRFMHAGSDERG